MRIPNGQRHAAFKIANFSEEVALWPMCFLFAGAGLFITALLFLPKTIIG